MKKRVIKQNLRQTVTLGVILIFGLLILNYKSLFPTQEAMVTSADKMSDYIIAEVSKQGKYADLDMICKNAQKLDSTGLKLVVDKNEFGERVINFYKAYEQPILIKELKVSK